MSTSNPKPTRARARAVRRLGALVIALVTPLALAVPARADDPTAATNDTSVRAATSFWWYHGVTATTLGSLLTTNNARITEINVDDPTTPTFTVSMVANSGPYASGWWWYYNETTAGVSATLSTNNARLLSVSPYQTSSGLRFAVVEVPNTGAQARAWWWYVGESASSVSTHVTANNARLVVLRPYVSGSTTEYVDVMIANSGYDEKPYAYAINQSLANIAAIPNADDVRAVSLSADPGGGFDAIFVGSEGETWDFWAGETAADVNTHLADDHTRLIDIYSYGTGASQRFTSVELDDTNALQTPVNGASTTADTYEAAHGWGAGDHGEYFAAVTPSGPGPSIIAANSSFRFEPASSIKILYALYAMRQVQLGNDSLTSDFVYYKDPSDPTNPDVCPDATWENSSNAVHTTLQNALEIMLQNSDNRATRGMALRYGVGNVNAFAAGLGLSNTNIGQAFIGCGFSGGARNNFTLADAGKIYAGIQNHTFLSTKNANKLFSFMLGGVPSSSSAWATVVNAEAAKLGKSSIAAAFLANMEVRDKAGSYAICETTCATYHTYLADNGRVLIPFKKSGVIKQKAYVYGGFVNDLTIGCVPGSACSAETASYAALSAVGPHDALTTIKKALETW